MRSEQLCLSPRSPAAVRFEAARRDAALDRPAGVLAMTELARLDDLAVDLALAWLQAASPSDDDIMAELGGPTAPPSDAADGLD